MGRDLCVLPGEARDGAVTQEAPHGRDTVDNSLCYMASAEFSTLRTLVEHSLLYMLKPEEQSDSMNVVNCQSKTGRLPLVFPKVLQGGWRNWE